MAKRLSWRPTKKQRRVTTWVVVAVGIFAIILIGYYFPLTGFDAYTPIKSGDVESTVPTSGVSN